MLYISIFLSENIRVSELCIKGNAVSNERIWTVQLFTVFETFFNQFNAKYLVLFFLPENNRRAPLPVPGVGNLSLLKRKMRSKYLGY